MSSQDVTTQRISKHTTKWNQLTWMRKAASLYDENLKQALPGIRANEKPGNMARQCRVLSDLRRKNRRKDLEHSTERLNRGGPREQLKRERKKERTPTQKTPKNALNRAHARANRC